MPDVFLDGSRVDSIDTRNHATIGELMSAVESRLKELRRFILELWVDGTKLDESRRNELLSKPVSGYSDFEFKTVSIESLALEGVDMVQRYIATIRDNSRRCVRGIRHGDEDVDTTLSAVMEGVVDLVKTMDALVKGVEKYSIALFRESPARYFSPLLKAIDQVADESTSGDMRSVAEVLDYEISPMMDEMEAKLFFYADRRL